MATASSTSSDKESPSDSAKSTTSSNVAHVLYVDHQGHPAPLSMTYHATASRRLASAIDRHPPSTATEVDSAYCPQCLSFHDAATAARIGYCPSCKWCPICCSPSSVATVHVDIESNGDCYYQCGVCDWTSRDCWLITKVAIGNDGVVTKEAIDYASKELASQCLTLLHRRDQANQQDHYQQMLIAWEKITKKQMNENTNTTTSKTKPTKKRSVDGPEGWSVQSLEASIRSRQQLSLNEISEIVSGQELEIISLEADQKPLDQGWEGKSVANLLLQPTNSPQELLPLPVPLRTRKSRRCRAELAEGRPGILVKPKLNPLEGDTSLRTGHGQWWKKDSSAIHVVPRVQVICHGADQDRRALLLKITNPTLGAIRFRVQSSSYGGEPIPWDGDGAKTTLMEDLLVNVITQTKISLQLRPLIQIPTTDLIELEPAEDTFLELGNKSSHEHPKSVQHWHPLTVLAQVPKTTTNASSWIAQQASTAWLQIVIPEAKLETPAIPPAAHSGIAMALQIQVGDGSWESSLISPSPGEDGKDLVNFDLVVAWE